MKERIGFVSQLVDGTWSPVFNTEALARRFLRTWPTPANRRLVALPVYVDVPDVPSRPQVILTDNSRVRWNVQRGVYTVSGTDYPTLVALVKAFSVTDGDVDAIQALPADTDAWIAAGGVDAG